MVFEKRMILKRRISIAVLLNFCLASFVLADSNSEFLERLNQQMAPMYDMYERLKEEERQEAPKRAAREAEERQRIAKLDCAALDFMRKKYSDIGDSAYRAAMAGSTPAAVASSMTARQAYTKAQLYAQERFRRCY